MREKVFFFSHLLFVLEKRLPSWFSRKKIIYFPDASAQHPRWRALLQFHGSGFIFWIGFTITPDTSFPNKRPFVKPELLYFEVILWRKNLSVIFRLL